MTGIVAPRLDAPSDRESASGLLSYNQLALWFSYLENPSSHGYNVAGAVRIRSVIDADAVRIAVQGLLDQHPTLRTTFSVSSEGTPLQTIASQATVDLRIGDVTGSHEDELRRIIDRDFERPFDLEQGPLFRVSLYHRGPADHVFMMAAHHIVCDGWSMAMLWDQFLVRYAIAVGAGVDPIPRTGEPYAAFVGWQQAMLAGTDGQALLEHWQRVLAAPRAQVEVPSDYPRPERRTTRSLSRLFDLSPSDSAAVRALARANRTTPYVVLLAAFQALLARETGVADVIVGTPTLGRPHGRFSETIGPFVNPIAVRSTVHPTATVAELLTTVAAAVKQARRGADYPLLLAVRAASAPRDASRTPLFSTFFGLIAFDRRRDSARAYPGPLEREYGTLRFQRIPLRLQEEQFDLSLHFEEFEDRFEGAIQYNPDLYTGETIARLEAGYRAVLTGMLALDARSLRELTRVPGPAAAASGPAMTGTLQPVPRAGRLPISHVQQRLWFLDQLQPGNAHYNLYLALRIRGPLQVQALVHALNRLPERHETLRLRIREHEGQPVPELMETVPDVVTRIDLSSTPASGQESQARALVLDHALTPFDLATGPMAGFLLITLAPDHYLLAGRMHHIAADGWSLAVAAREIFAEYQATIAGRPSPLPALPIQYVDYAAWQQEQLQGEMLQAQVQYWRSELAGIPSAVALPSDRPRPDRQSFRGTRVEFHLPLAELQAIRSVAQNHGATLFMVLLSAWQVLLHRLSGQDDVAVGSPFANRDDPRLEGLIGCFVNNVVLRGRLGGDPTYREVLRRTRDTVLGAFDHRELPFDLLVEALRPERTTRHSPVFQVMFTLHSFPPGAPALDGLIVDFVKIADEGRGSSRFDITLEAEELPTGLHLMYEYATDLFDASTIARMHAQFVAVLRAVVESVDVRIAEIPIGVSAAPALSGTAAAVPAVAGTTAPSLRAATAPLDGGAVTARVTRIWCTVLGIASATEDDNFFDLGGHSLLVVKLHAALRQEFGRTLVLVDLFQHVTIRSQVALLSDAPAPTVGADRPELQPIPRTGILPVSSAQERLWFLDQLQPGSAQYNIPLPIRITGAIDRDAFLRALHALGDRHEALRTTFVSVDGVPGAAIRASLGAFTQVIDLADLPADVRAAEAVHRARTAALSPFDLAHGPLVSAVLLVLAPDEHVLVLTMHHSIADGWSVGVAARDVCLAYLRESGISDLALPEPLPIQYADYAAWQRALEQSGADGALVEYWRNALAGAPALLELPTDRSRPATQSHRGTRRQFWIDPVLMDGVRALARDTDVTLYMLLLSAWQVVLHRYSGQDDVLVGSPFANRDDPRLEGLVGCFVNNVVIRGRFDGDPTFRAFLAQMRETVLGAFQHRDLPFDRLVEALRPERSESYAPVFQVMFTLQSFPVEFVAVPGVQLEVLPLDDAGLGHARFDITLEAEEVDRGLNLVYEYATDLFEAETIVRMQAHFEALLRAVVSSADSPVSAIPLLTDADDAVLFDRINATAVDHDRIDRADTLVAAIAARVPHQRAVTAGEETLTYAELMARASQVANALRAMGVVDGARVGVCLDRTVDLPVVLLAIWQAGAAYVPVDPTHPADRVQYSLHDAAVTCVVTVVRFAPLVGSDAPLLCLDADAARIAACDVAPPQSAARAEDLAYLLYTSGSTGRPKGVEVEHRNLVNFLRGMATEPGFTADDVLLAVTTPSFDIAGLELWLPLVTGASVVIASRMDVLDGEALGALLERHAVTVMQATPATWRLLLDTGWTGKPDLRVLCGGEALPRALASALLPRVGALWNMYGPTETTIWSTVHRVEAVSGEIPIGHPIANTQVYVLDRHDQPTPLGVAGELCIGGEGVARGYRGRPELTEEKFVTLSIRGRAPTRVYRTGDVARFRGDHALEFVGRRDHQVKVRGYRIELGEIEAVLASASGIRRAVVIVREDTPGDQRIVAYVVLAPQATVSHDQLRTHLRAALPAYMLPGAIVELPDLPLTPNGKVDRKALPAPSDAVPSAPLAANSPLPLPTPEPMRPALAPVAAAPSPHTLAGAAQRRDRPSEWLYAPTWVRLPLGPVPPVTHGLWIVCGAGDALEAAVGAELRRRGATVHLVSTGDHFSVSEDRITVRADNDVDVERLFELLEQSGTTLAGIIDLRHLPDSEFAAGAAGGVRALQALGRLLSASHVTRDGSRMLVATAGAQSVLDEPITDPARAMLVGTILSLPLERPGIRASLLDLDSAWITRAPEETAAVLCDEAVAFAGDQVGALRMGKRWVKRFSSLDPAADPMDVAPLVPGGVYLVLDGLSIHGAVFSEWIARAAHPRLLVTSAQALPPRAAWRSWLEAHDDADDVSRRIRVVQHLEAAGATVRVEVTDGTDAQALGALLAESDSLSGVVLVSASPEPPTALTVTGAVAEHRVVTPATASLSALATALGDRSLDFLLISSSLVTAYGEPGRSAHAAACAWLEAFVQSPACLARWNAAAVAWDSTGDTTPDVLYAGFRDVLPRILTSRLPLVAVTPYDLEQALRERRRGVPMPAVVTPAETTAVPRAVPAAAPVGELTPTMQQIARIWSELLGRSEVAPDDSFFELGGHSLLGTRVLARIADTFGVRLPLRAIFEAPRLRDLAALIDTQVTPGDRQEFEL